MANYDDFCARYELHRKAQERANKHNKTIVFDALAAAGITAVTVNFNGEGDSGQIEDMTAHAGPEASALPDAEVEILKASWNSGETAPRHVPLTEAIEELCYDLLSQEHEGWENNDGAFGDFTFDVARRQVRLVFNARFTDFATIGHTF